MVKNEFLYLFKVFSHGGSSSSTISKSTSPPIVSGATGKVAPESSGGSGGGAVSVDVSPSGLAAAGYADKVAPEPVPTSKGGQVFGESSNPLSPKYVGDVSVGSQAYEARQVEAARQEVISQQQKVTQAVLQKVTQAVLAKAPNAPKYVEKAPQTTSYDMARIQAFFNPAARMRQTSLKPVDTYVLPKGMERKKEFGTTYSPMPTTTISSDFGYGMFSKTVPSFKAEPIIGIDIQPSKYQGTVTPTTTPSLFSLSGLSQRSTQAQMGVWREENPSLGFYKALGTQFAVGIPIGVAAGALSLVHPVQTVKSMFSPSTYEQIGTQAARSPAALQGQITGMVLFGKGTGYVAAKVTPKAVGFVRTIGREKVPLAKIGVETKIPTSTKITPESLLKSFKEGTLYPKPENIVNYPKKAYLPSELEPKVSFKTVSPIEYAKQASFKGEFEFKMLSKEQMVQQGFAEEGQVPLGAYYGKEIIVQKGLPKSMLMETIAHEVIHLKTPKFVMKSPTELLPYGFRPSEIIAYGLEKKYATQGFKIPVVEKVPPKSYIWHAAAGSFKAVTTAGKGTSEIRGLYGAPVLESYFLKVKPSGYSLVGGEIPKIKLPSAIRIEVKGFEPVKLGEKIGKQYPVKDFTKGYAELVKGKQVPFKKVEYEAVLPEGTQLIRTGKTYYTKVEGIRVPIQQYRVAGVGEKGISYGELAKKYSGYSTEPQKIVSVPSVSLGLKSSVKPSISVSSVSRVSGSVSKPSAKTTTSSVFKPSSKTSYKVSPSIKPSVSYGISDRVSYVPSGLPSVSLTSSVTILTPSGTVPPPTTYIPSYTPPTTPPYKPTYYPSTKKKVPWIPTTPSYTPSGYQPKRIQVKRGVTGFQTFVRRFGKFKALSGITTRAEAIRKGESVARSTLAATFKIKPTTTLVSGIEAEYLPSKAFRGYRIVKGKKLPTPEQWIQMRGRRLESIGERKSIQAARKQGGMKWF